MRIIILIVLIGLCILLTGCGQCVECSGCNDFGCPEDGRTIACNQKYGEDNWYIPDEYLKNHSGEICLKKNKTKD